MSDFDPDRGTAREVLFRLLAASYYQPAPDFADGRVFETLRLAAARAEPDLTARANRVARAFAATPIGELLTDYGSLFLGHDDIVAAPYGSAWLSSEDALMQDSTAAVLELYRQGEFELPDELRELPDHIAAELEFLSHLALKENCARHDQDSDALSGTLALRKRFLEEHLGAWIDGFAAAMSQNAGTDFYRELAGLTQYAVVDEIARDT